MKDENGSWLGNRDDIGQSLCRNFIQLFSSDNPQFLSNLEGLVTNNITEEEKDYLVALPSADEVKAVVFSMKSNKVVGSDGMSPIFYKHYWHIIWGGGDVIVAMRCFFNWGYMLREVNHTFITLIPKSGKAASINKFRPISLCNVIYNTISKILANRLKLLLHKLVSPWQEAFIPGRMIHDNSIIAQEIIHSMDRKQGKRG
jgi:hypothetical protein